MLAHVAGMEDIEVHDLWACRQRKDDGLALHNLADVAVAGTHALPFPCSAVVVRPAGVFGIGHGYLSPPRDQ